MAPKKNHTRRTHTESERERERENTTAVRSDESERPRCFWDFCSDADTDLVVRVDILYLLMKTLVLHASCNRSFILNSVWIVDITL